MAILRLICPNCNKTLIESDQDTKLIKLANTINTGNNFVVDGRNSIIYGRFTMECPECKTISRQ